MIQFQHRPYTCRQKVDAWQIRVVRAVKRSSHSDAHSLDQNYFFKFPQNMIILPHEKLF